MPPCSCTPRPCSHLQSQAAAILQCLRLLQETKRNQCHGAKHWGSLSLSPVRRTRKEAQNKNTIRILPRRLHTYIQVAVFVTIQVAVSLSVSQLWASFPLVFVNTTSGDQFIYCQPRGACWEHAPGHCPPHHPCHPQQAAPLAARASCCGGRPPHPRHY